MDLVKYAKGVKSLKKKDVYDTIALQKGMVNTIKNMLALNASNDVGYDQYAQRWALTKGILKDVGRRVTNPSMTDIFVDSIKGIEFILSRLEQQAKGIDDTIDGTTLTIKETNILIILDNIGFWTGYTLDLVEVLSSFALEGKEDERGINKADLTFLNKTWSYYSDLSVQFMAEPDQIVRRLEKLSDVPADQDSVDIVQNAKGRDAVNAMRGFGIHTVLPAYWILDIKKNVDLARIRANQKRIEIHSMKLEQLMNKRNGSNDPHLDRQIEIYQNDIIKAKAKIEDIVESYQV